LGGFSPPQKKNLQSTPLNGCQKLCALNLFFGRVKELQVYRENFLLMHNKHRKLFVTECTKMRLAAGLHPDPLGELLQSALPQAAKPPSYNGWPASNGRDGRIGRGREEKTPTRGGRKGEGHTSKGGGGRREGTEGEGKGTPQKRVKVSRTSYCPGGGETICPRRWQFDSRRIYVRPWTGPQSAHG